MSIIARLPKNIKFLTAQEWGMTWKRAPVREALLDPELMIHHSGGSRWHSTDPVIAFQRINRWAQDYKNHSAIGYDTMIHLNKRDMIATIGEARGGWRSASQLDRNDMAESVCILGYFHPGNPLSENPTDLEIEAAAWAAAISMERGYTRRDARFLGHRENPAHPGATPCPGDYLFPHVQHIGQRARDIYNATNEEDMIQTANERVLDTRWDNFNPLQGGKEQRVSLPAPYRAAKAVLINITTIDPLDRGFITAWGSGVRPETAAHNYGGRSGNTGNLAFVPVVNGAIMLFARSTTDLTIDVQGYQL